MDNHGHPEDYELTSDVRRFWPVAAGIILGIAGTVLIVAVAAVG